MHCTKATDGTEALPLGTVTIQEIKPPKGHFLNEEVFVCQGSNAEGCGRKNKCISEPYDTGQGFPDPFGEKKATETAHPLSAAQFKQYQNTGWK